jgi:hypothetical protein
VSLGGLQNEQDLNNWLRRQFPILSAIDNLANLSAINFNTATLTWPGANNVATTTTVTHGLGVTPTSVVATVNTLPGAFMYFVVAASTFTSTTFKLDALCVNAGPPAAAATGAVSWIAVV